MSLVLSPATEARIQAELATGRYAAPDEILNRALDSLEAERTVNEPIPKEMEDWLLRNKEAISRDLEESFAQSKRGEGYSPEESRALLAQHRTLRAA